MNSLIHGLMRPEAYDHPVRSFRLLETHISWVILTGEYAYKLKKPVNLGFVDFTTLERRRHFCDEEIRLNRRLAADLYLQVRPIYGTEQTPTFIGAGEPIEYAVQMRQFEQSCLLPEVLKRGELLPEHIDRLGSMIADFHRSTTRAEVSSLFGSPDSIRTPAIANFDALRIVAGEADRISFLRNWAEMEFRKLCKWFQNRHDEGFIRECHGDMHLGNMVLLEGIVRIFDCLEFNPELRWVDLLSEISFLVMDLQERGRLDLGIRVLNRWLEQTGDYDGLVGWRWYFVYRAMVRAKVAALRLQQADIEAAERDCKQAELSTYLSLAVEWTKRHPTAVIIMHGLSGSGKSRVAQEICEQFAAICLRSDVERKRLFHVWGAPGPTRLTGDMYASEVTDDLYRKVLSNHIPPMIEAGFPVVVDAACLHRWQREVFREIAANLNVPFVIVDIHAPTETLRQRLTDRLAQGTDPSDATIAVMEHQLQHRELLADDEISTTIFVDSQNPDWSTGLKCDLIAHLR